MINKNTIKLSITIPTYNRAKYLDECLNSIYDQKEVNFNEIEIVVSDNNSSDETESVINKWKQKFSIFIYKKNSVNLGPTRNIRNVLNLGRGDYIWLFGDDDIFLKDYAIKKILDIASDDKYAFIWVGSTEIGKSHKRNKDRLIEVDHIKLLSSLDSGLISRYIFQKKAYSETKRTFFETYLDQIGIILEISYKNKSLIVTDSLVGARRNNSSIISRTIFLDYIKIINDFKNIYPEKEIKKFKRRIFWSLLIFNLAGAKINRETEYNEEFVKYYKDFPFIMFVYKLIWYITPRKILLLFKKLYRRFIKA